MSLPYLICVTSKQCPACDKIRGDGTVKEPIAKLVPGPIFGSYWSPTFFKSLLMDEGGQPRFNVMEVRFPTLTPPSILDMIEISEFKFGRIFERITYTPNQQLVDRNINGKKSPLIEKINFQQLILSKVPKELINYVYIFPAWIFVDGPIWDRAILGQGHLFAQVISCQTIPRDIDQMGTQMYGVNLDQKTLTAGEDPIKVANDYARNPQKLLPPPPSSPDPVKVVSEEKKDPEGYPDYCSVLGYRIIGRN